MKVQATRVRNSLSPFRFLQKIQGDSERFLHKVEKSGIKNIFDFDSLNLYEDLGYRLHYFFWRIFEAVNSLEKNDWKHTASVDPENAYNPTILISPLNYSLIGLVENIVNKSKLKKSGPKTKPVKVFVYKITIIRLLEKFFNFLLPGKFNVVIVSPVSHVLKMRKFFKELQEKNISYILLTYNLDFASTVKLIVSGVRFMDKNYYLNVRNNYDLEGAFATFGARWDKFVRESPLFKKSHMRSFILNEALKLRIHTLLNIEAKEIISDHIIARSVFSLFQPKCLITSTDPDAKVLPYIFEAKSRNLKTISLQHATYAFEKSVNFKSDKGLVWGTYYKKWFEKKLKKKSQDLIITGSPFFDNLKVKRVEGINKEPKDISVLILLENVYFLKKKFGYELKEIISDILNNNIRQVYIRPHPWQDVSSIIDAFKKNFKGSIIIDSNNNLSKSIEKNDLVITMDTTAGFSALILGKKIIYWDFFGKENLPYRMGGVPVAKTPEEIRDFMIKIINNKFKSFESKRKKLLKDIFYKLDGRSSQRVVNFLESELRR